MCPLVRCKSPNLADGWHLGVSIRCGPWPSGHVEVRDHLCWVSWLQMVVSAQSALSPVSFPGLRRCSLSPPQTSRLNVQTLRSGLVSLLRTLEIWCYHSHTVKEETQVQRGERTFCKLMSGGVRIFFPGLSMAMLSWLMGGSNISQGPKEDFNQLRRI